MHETAFLGESLPDFPGPDTIAAIGGKALIPYEAPRYYEARGGGGGSESTNSETPPERAARLAKELKRIDTEFDEVKRIGRPRKNQ